MKPTSALILVDLQNDFLPGGALAVQDGDQVIPVANRLLSKFTVVVATQDWHPADHASFAANHRGKRPGEMIELGGLQQVLWPVHCVQQSKGAAFSSDLLLEPDRVEIIKKGTDPSIDSYSGFFDNDGRRSTGLNEYLCSHRVTDVYVMGLATDYCVKFTALDAIRMGFTTYLVEDGCRGVNLSPGDVDRSIAELRERGVRVVASCEIE